MSRLVDLAAPQSGDRDGDLSLLNLNCVELWSRLYPDELYHEEDFDDLDDNFLPKLQNAQDDGAELKKVLIRIMCVIDMSSDCTVVFEGEEEREILNNIAAKIPSALPADVLPLLSQLQCLVTSAGYGYVAPVGKPWEQAKGEAPEWTTPLLEACIRCAAGDSPSCAFRAVHRIMRTPFRWVMNCFPGLDAVFARAAQVTTDATAAPLSIVCAAQLLSARLVSAKTSDEESVAAFVPLQDLLAVQLAVPEALGQAALGCFEHVMGGARILTRHKAGCAHLVNSGFLRLVLEIACSLSGRQDEEAQRAMLSAGLCISALVVPSEVAIESCEDSDAMRTVFAEIRASKRDVCDLVLSLKGTEVLAAALVGDESGDHLSSPNPRLLEALIALLAFGDDHVSEQYSRELAEDKAFLTCVCDHHARNLIYTRSGKNGGGSGIWGMTKEAALSRLLLACFLPSCYPVGLDLAPNSRRKAAKTTAGQDPAVAPVQPPTPLEVLQQALETRDRSQRQYVLSDWVLALSCLDGRKA